jgi:hypothetical protein
MSCIKYEILSKAKFLFLRIPIGCAVAFVVDQFKYKGLLGSEWVYVLIFSIFLINKCEVSSATLENNEFDQGRKLLTKKM